MNFPTKRHWRGNGRVEDIEAGLDDAIRGRNIRSTAVPSLGSGFGGLDWNDVRPRIEKTLPGFDGLDAVILEPTEVPSARRMSRSPSGIDPAR